MLFPEQEQPGDEERFAAVTHWRVALWQPWRERRVEPAKTTPPKRQLNLAAAATWNINGFWAKQGEVSVFLREQKVAVLALQETLVTAKHYVVRMEGYKCYQSNAEEDFRGCAMLVDSELASYKVPHGLRWLTHVKVFGYAGWNGPTHFFSVYLKSGGNHRRNREEALEELKAIVNRTLNNTNDFRVIVLGDFNEETDKVMRHLSRGPRPNNLVPAAVVGSDSSCFPVVGRVRSLDHFLLNDLAKTSFRCARVHREYCSSDHRPVVITPRKQLPSSRPNPTWTAFDNKAIRLKSDQIVNDNAWSQLIITAYGTPPDDEDDPNSQAQEDPEAAEGDGGVDIVAAGVVRGAQALVLDQAEAFISTFDRVCRKHGVKKVCQSGVRSGLLRKLKSLLAVVKRYMAKFC